MCKINIVSFSINDKGGRGTLSFGILVGERDRIKTSIFLGKMIGNNVEIKRKVMYKSNFYSENRVPQNYGYSN